MSVQNGPNVIMLRSGRIHERTRSTRRKQKLNAHKHNTIHSLARSDISLNNKLNKWLAMETVIITDKHTGTGKGKATHGMCMYATHPAIDQHNKQFSCIGFVKLEKCTKGDSHVFLSHWISCLTALIYTVLK